jgi:hypothetical protein
VPPARTLGVAGVRVIDWVIGFETASGGLTRPVQLDPKTARIVTSAAHAARGIFVFTAASGCAYWVCLSDVPMLFVVLGRARLGCIGCSPTLTSWAGDFYSPKVQIWGLYLRTIGVVGGHSAAQIPKITQSNWARDRRESESGGTAGG